MDQAVKIMVGSFALFQLDDFVAEDESNSAEIVHLLFQSAVLLC